MLNACIIGAGFAAGLHALAYQECAHLCGVCSPDAAQAKALAERFGCQAYTDARRMLQSLRPDVVSVCVPTDLHADMVCLAASLGCHVLCEKPLALTDGDCARMVEAARESGVCVMAAQVLRWWPEYRRARELLQEGGVETIRCWRASRLLHTARSDWFLDAARSGGALFDLMAHDADYMLWVLGDRIERLYAVGRQNARGAWTHINVVLRYTSGVCATLEAGYDEPAGFPFTTLLRVSGERGCIEVETGAEGNIGAGVKPYTRLTRLRDGQRAGLSVTDEAENAQERAFRDEVRAFVRAAAENLPCPIPLEDSVRVIRLLNLIGASLEEEREITRVNERLNARR